MKYEVLKSCVIDGRPRNAKTIVSLADQKEASELMAMGRIAPYQEPEPALEDRSIGYSQATAPKKRARQKRVEPSAG